MHQPAPVPLSHDPDPRIARRRPRLGTPDLTLTLDCEECGGIGEVWSGDYNGPEGGCFGITCPACDGAGSHEVRVKLFDGQWWALRRSTKLPHWIPDGGKHDVIGTCRTKAEAARCDWWDSDAVSLSEPSHRAVLRAMGLDVDAACNVGGVR
jgi:hypothetical protein